MVHGCCSGCMRACMHAPEHMTQLPATGSAASQRRGKAVKALLSLCAALHSRRLTAGELPLVAGKATMRVSELFLAASVTMPPWPRGMTTPPMM